MATPGAFSADTLAEMMRMCADLFQPPKTLLVSGGVKERLRAEFIKSSPDPAAAGLMGFGQHYMGIPIETFDIPPEEVFDWSGCRSPARAKRRHARGIPQRVKITLRERAFLIDKRVLGDITGRFDRMAVKMLYGK